MVNPVSNRDNRVQYTTADSVAPSSTLTQFNLSFPTSHTEAGRLIPAQRFLVNQLRSLMIDHPIIFDFGIGMGAPTVIDLATIVREAGFTRATIIGVDANSRVLQASWIINSNPKQSAPPNINIYYVAGDISNFDTLLGPLATMINYDRCASLSSSSSDIAINPKAHLCLSANLIPALNSDLRDRALQNMINLTRSGGLIGLGQGGVTDGGLNLRWGQKIGGSQSVSFSNINF